MFANFFNRFMLTIDQNLVIAIDAGLEVEVS